MYPNGTQVTLLTSDPILHFSISPTGWAAAYITNSDPDTFMYEKPYGYTLKIITLYDQRIYTVTSLDPPGLSADSQPDVLNSAFQAVQAYHRGALAWSPNGQKLAFASLHETSPDQLASSDIYIHTMGSNTLRKLTALELPQGPGRPYNLSWSPFGESVYYAVAYSFESGAGDWLAGAWVTHLDGPSIQVAAGEETGGESMFAWQTAGTFLLSSWNSDCGDQNLRKVHLQNRMRDKAVTPLWAGCYSAAHYNPMRDEILISVVHPQPGSATDQLPGLYLVNVSHARVNPLASQGFERILTNPNRSGGSRPAWLGYKNGEGLFTIQRSGTIEPLFTEPPYNGFEGPAMRPLFALAGDDWLWAGDGLFLGRPGFTPHQIIDVPVSHLSPSPTVEGLYFFLAPAQDSIQLFAVHAGDWQPYIVDERIMHPQRVGWTGR